MLYSLPITYDFSGFSVTSVSGCWERNQKQLQDGTEQVQGFLGTPSFDPALGGIGPTQLLETELMRINSARNCASRRLVPRV